MNKFLLVVLIIIGGILSFSIIRVMFKYFSVLDFVVLTFCAIIAYSVIVFYNVTKNRSSG